MALARLALRTTNVTINNASVEYRTAAGAKARILELSIVQVTATASSYGIGRPNAVGVTPGTTSLFQRDDSNDPACVTSGNLTWGTSPTAPAIYMGRWNSAATIGVGKIWTFGRPGVVIPVSSSFVIFNVTASVPIDAECIIDE